AKTPYRWLVLLHIAAGTVAALLLTSLWRVGGPRRAFATAMALAILLPVASRIRDRFFPSPKNRIVNPVVVAASMEEEGGGPSSPFFPPGAVTSTGGVIPSDFFMDSQACAACHKDIYDQWNSSAHHFGSFNNQFYRKSIEYMQDVVGTKPSKWCAG